MFSNTVKLVDLDDYLTPSEECIKLVPKPSESTTKNVKIELDDFGNDLSEDTNKSSIRPNQIIPKSKADGNGTIAKVNLYDCLACSGCVTTSEVILLQDQGIKNFVEMSKNKKNGVFILSPQSRVSQSNYLGLDENILIVKLTKYLSERFNIGYVLDMQFFIDLSQNLCAFELKQQFDKDDNIKKPIITSECPGWICYLEKTLKENYQDHASRVKTPQQIAAQILKKFFYLIRNKDKLTDNISIEQFLQESMSNNPESLNEVFLGSIQPCFDKKLEFFRPETHINEQKTMDIVLTTSEIKELIEQDRNKFDEIEVNQNETFCYNFQTAFANFVQSYKGNLILPEEKLRTQTVQDFDFSVNSSKHSTSNNYVYSVQSLIDPNLLESNIEYISRKNCDTNFQEATFQAFDNIKTIKVAKIYGFKNLANLVRQIKTKRCDYDFVEIMACPGGCLNGGKKFIKVFNKFRWPDQN